MVGSLPLVELVLMLASERRAGRLAGRHADTSFSVEREVISGVGCLGKLKTTGPYGLCLFLLEDGKEVLRSELTKLKGL